jgi:UDP-glucose-4-epimerase GalE
LYYRNNVAGTISLVEAMKRCNISKLVFSSTCATYGNPTVVPIVEETPQKPINPYGKTKLMVEWMLKDLCAAHKWSCASLRYFNAAGASPDGGIGEDHNPETHLIPLALFAAAGGSKSLEIFGTDYPTPDGTCIRDYIHVDDLANAHRLALEKTLPGEHLCLNLGTGKGNSVYEILNAVKDITGKAVPFTIGARREGDPPALVASCKKANLRLGWEANYKDIREIITTAWRWHQSHPEGYNTR